MSAKNFIYEDIENLEEKLQSLKSKLGKEEYEAIDKQIEEIKKLGIELPDSHYITDINSIITRIVNLEVDNFNEQDTKKLVKELKREGFLARLEYIKISMQSGKDVKEILQLAKAYWGNIKGIYDEIEALEVGRMIDEIDLEIDLKEIQDTKSIDLGKVGNNKNYYSIREKMQEILESPSTNEEKRLLIKSWLAESIDVETGKIDEKVMGRLAKDKQVWEVLAVVEELSLKIEKQNEDLKDKFETKTLMPIEDSEARKNEIKKLSEKYGIPLEKFDFSKKKYREAIYIMKKKRFGKEYYVLTSKEYVERFENRNKVLDIEAVIFNNNITHVGRGHISGTENTLRDVVFSDRLEAIYDEAFAHCTELKSVTFPKTLKTIKKYAFFCAGLENVELPGSVEEMGRLAFGYNNFLESLKLNEGIKVIGDEAFENGNLRKVDLPNSVREIGNLAFAGNLLSKVTFGNKLEAIWRKAFMNCNLEEVILPESVKVVGEEAFKGNPIKKAVVPKNTDLGSGAFVQYDIFNDEERPSVSRHVQLELVGEKSSGFSRTQDSDVHMSMASNHSTPIQDLTKLVGTTEKSAEELEAENKKLQAENQVLHSEIESLRKEMAELKSLFQSRNNRNEGTMDR